MTREQHESKIDVHGWPNRHTWGDGPCLVPSIKVAVNLPFNGDSLLWRLQPNTWGGSHPHGTIRGAFVEMIFERPLDDQVEQIRNDLEGNLKLIRSNILNQEPSIAQFNIDLQKRARSCIEARRQRLATHDKIASILNIPLTHSPGAPEIRSIPVERRIIKPLPPPPIGGFKPEWEISAQEYDNILTIIRHEGRTFEATPKTYAVHDEEEMRDIILAHLNGHYKGGASGETFRRSGKTDIRIETESRAAFVAECKIWKGPKSIPDTIDQLLDYLIWRDCKTAVIIFNKNVAGFTDIIDKSYSAIQSHPRFMKTENVIGPGDWSCVFRSKDDDARLVHIHVFVFNLFVSKRSTTSEGSLP